MTIKKTNLKKKTVCACVTEDREKNRVTWAGNADDEDNARAESIVHNGRSNTTNMSPENFGNDLNKAFEHPQGEGWVGWRCEVS